jgi:hypothetical protein
MPTIYSSIDKHVNLVMCREAVRRGARRFPSHGIAGPFGDERDHGRSQHQGQSHRRTWTAERILLQHRRDLANPAIEQAVLALSMYSGGHWASGDATSASARVAREK